MLLNEAAIVAKAMVCYEHSVQGTAALRKHRSSSLLHILYLGNFSSLFFSF